MLRDRGVLNLGPLEIQITQYQRNSNTDTTKIMNDK